MKSLFLFSLVLPAACSGGDGSDPLFPEDYAATYNEVRDCRTSSDHDLNRVRILADPLAEPAYLGRDRPFPTDAIVLKEEYDFSDENCAGEIIQWSVMKRLADGTTAPNLLDWTWQRVNADREVTLEDDQRCSSCHVECTCESPIDPDPGCLDTEGYAYTCAAVDGGG